MAAPDHSLSTPLLSDHHLILTVHGDPSPPFINPSDDNPLFTFIGANNGFDVPESSAVVDPLRNHTPNVQGLYEWVKIVIWLPIVAARLALFGISLTLGYVVTLTALKGWKDR